MNNQTTAFGIFILAFISAVLNFAGLLHLIGEGDWWLKSLAALTAVAVWILLYLFWVHAFSIVPDLKLPGKRVGGWITVSVGCAFILALSTYWNLVAYSASEINKLSQQGTARQAEILLAGAIKANGAYISLKPQLDAFEPRITALADGEEKSGAISGIHGKGGVSATLRQLASNVGSAANAVEEASNNIAALKSKGQTCVANLRSVIRKGGNSAEQSDAVSAQVDCLNSVVADLGNQDVAALIERSMKGLTAGIVLPVTLKTKKQKLAVKNVLSGLQKQADTIAAAAASINKVNIEPLSVERPNVVRGVLIYWKSIIPAIGTAVAIDLLPLLLLIFKVILYRDAEAIGEPRHPWTIKELMDAQAQLEKLEGANNNLQQPKALFPPPKAITYQPDDEDDDDDWWDITDLGDEKNEDQRS